MSFIDYLKSTKGELKHVNWPTKNQAIAYTTIVIAIAFVIGFYLGAFDFIFTTILRNFLI
ncbi:MAG: preprotein translocase subunit SecE [Candidatus Vogelbacteria bacterium RIFOXYD1_FULL_46_19]|uniref:Protein translocase subunit SecE n=1 Tax=Candidatus Vogelbacteria bacterium RIFOXYD1_FULL_46_19 TaxID=1802439 RepID=A0A1G2QHK9_9BACT|nr:MAG: preprotein translocase subunit SecE [Candidatus Vogelbacteria bacterium RIFOXYD1_FULL_46_19]